MAASDWRLPCRVVPFTKIILRDGGVADDKSFDASLAKEIKERGLRTCFTVEPRAAGYLIFQGHEEYRAIAALMAEEAACYDPRTGKLTPATKLYAFVPCRFGCFCIDDMDLEPDALLMLHQGFGGTGGVGVLGAGGQSKRQPKLDVSPFVQTVTEAVLAGRQDAWLVWEAEGRVRVLVSKVVCRGSAIPPTLAARRKRLRKGIAQVLAASCWRMVEPNVFQKCMPSSEEERHDHEV